MRRVLVLIWGKDTQKNGRNALLSANNRLVIKIGLFGAAKRDAGAGVGE